MQSKVYLTQKLLIIILLLLCIPLNAQVTSQPIKWECKAVSSGGNNYTIQVKGIFTDEKWHIYDLGPYIDGPNATALVINDKNVILRGGAKITSPIKKKFDSVFSMEIGTCEKVVTIIQKIQKKVNNELVLGVTIEWQACDDGSCLPPTEQEFQVTLPKSIAQNVQEVASPVLEAPHLEDNRIKKIEEVKQKVENTQSIWTIILEAIIWGFVALLTPCVFPMVPMTVSFFIKSNHNSAKDRTRGRLMALLYGLSIVALYTIPVAIIIGITYFGGGESVAADIFNWLATHWVPNVLFFLIFMVFAASFFGAFEITLPSWMVNKSDSNSEKGGLVGVFFMAMTLVLVSFSCTGPIVGSVLIKSTQGEIWQPIITMLAFSTAFALPFTLFAFAPSLLKELPKSGGWLNSVKVVLGFIEVALGFKFLSVADQTYHWGLLDREVYLAIWIVTFALLGFYLLGKLRFVHDDILQTITVKRLTLSIVTFSFVVYMIPGMWGAPLKALSGYLPPITSMDFNLSQPQLVDNAQNTKKYQAKYSDFLSLPHGLDGFFEYNEALAFAKRAGKPLFVDFTGHACVNCRAMESRVWSDPKVLKLLKENFVILALYADDKKEAAEIDWITTQNGQVLKSIGKINSYVAMSKFNVNAQPYYAIIDPNTEKHLVPPRAYNLDIDSYIKFLEGGLK